MSISQLINQPINYSTNQSVKYYTFYWKIEKKSFLSINNTYFVLVPAENSADVSNFTAQLIVKGKIDNMYVYIFVFFYFFLWFTKLISNKKCIPYCIAPIVAIYFISDLRTLQ